ncbi:ABC transporter substrate-binding protein [Skermanella aerolata]|uniref:ABC transporter substrate-binding protein n=1 Tax=Skermanella aerolata TaxID=393310 RepID=A0A512E2E6_9PROT|nr:ABC transporter substrate-binding protein [Skermanella aerolata]KJB91403.1 ABC transporter substrate-binding protein [Skermanella aerolata KACC 11604]GEO42884.1 ABC transporter substrate-binding protein [Skermanella aerolata]
MKQSIRKALVSAAATILLGGIAPAASARDIVWARYGDMDTLDPHRATSTLSLQVWSLVYDTLLAVDATGKPVPNVARSWTTSTDGTEYTFKLNEGVVCHDGTPLDANDVKYTVDRAFDTSNPSLTKASWGPVTSVEVIDPLTVTIKLDKPFVALVPFLADSFSSIICDSSKDAPGFGSTAAIGSGPWKFVSWTKGDRIVLTGNTSYRNFGKLAENKGAPYMEGLVITTVPEPQARLAGLKTGAIQIAEPPLDDVPALKQSGDLKIVIAGNTGQNVFWEFAVHRPPFNDPRARRAVAHATDAAAAIDLIYGDLSLPEKCPISRGVFGNDQEFCARHGQSYDPEKARALLAELGYGPDKPLEVTMIAWTGGKRDKLAEVFQSQLAEVGITARIEIMDIGTMNARVRQENEKRDGIGSLDMMTWSWFDPDILYALWHSPGAYRGYTSSELDAMLEKTRVLSDQAEREAAVRDVMAYLLENAIHVPLYTPGWEWVFAVRPEVTGFKVAPFVYPVFNDVRF